MIKKNYKFRLPQGKVLRFTPTGKSIPLSAQEIADDQLLGTVFPSFEGPPQVREVLLAAYRGENLRRFM
jgi:hypothetical protein